MFQSLAESPGHTNIVSHAVIIKRLSNPKNPRNDVLVEPIFRCRHSVYKNSKMACPYCARIHSEGTKHCHNSETIIFLACRTARASTQKTQCAAITARTTSFPHLRRTFCDSWPKGPEKLAVVALRRTRSCRAIRRFHAAHPYGKQNVSAKPSKE